MTDAESIETIFARVLEMSVLDRESFLATTSPAIADQIRQRIRAESIEGDDSNRFSATHSDSQENLENQSPGNHAPTIDLTCDDTSRRSTPVHSNFVTDGPTQIGRYTIVSELGRGGQGAVYRALHPNLPVELAIKVSTCRVGASDQASIRKEAGILCELEHENIARIRDLDVHQGQPFLVLDFVRGRSLAELLLQGNTSTEQAVNWLRSVAAAVDYAHRRGVLHLDLKPANIVVDENGSPKVIDFGLARIRGAWRDPSQERNVVSGTVSYMSPEQALGKASEIGSSSDVFGLGAILYRILAGSPPFKGATPGETFQAARKCEFDSTVLQGTDLPKRYVDVCLKALSANPKDRYESALAFADALGTPKSDDKIAASISGKFLGCGVSLAVTMAALLCIIIVPGVVQNSSSRVGSNLTNNPSGSWGWSSESATPAQATPEAYLLALADGANAWFDQQPADQSSLEKRLREFKSGCEWLLSQEHGLLAKQDRNWLRYKCTNWKRELGQQISQIDDQPFANAIAAANVLAREIVETLKQRSTEV